MDGTETGGQATSATAATIASQPSAPSAASRPTITLPRPLDTPPIPLRPFAISPEDATAAYHTAAHLLSLAPIGSDAAKRAAATVDALAPLAGALTSDALQGLAAAQAAGKEWYKSKAVWGSVAAIGASIAAGIFHHPVPGDWLQQAPDIAVIVAGGAGGVVALIGRLVASKPLT